MESNIQHDKDAQKFFVIIDGEEALLEYYPQDDQTLVFNHTYVPHRLRGKGIAGNLTNHALNYAKKNNFKVVPQCSYVESYVQGRKEFDDIIVF